MMTTTSRFIRVAAILGLTALMPQRLESAPFGSTFKATAEALGLRPVDMPDDVSAGTRVRLTVINPARLASRGLTGLKAGDKVEITVLEGNRFTVSRVVPTLLVVLNDKQAIQRSELVPLNSNIVLNTKVPLKQ